MRKVKSWISAFRLRTLPLSLSSILVGSIIAYSQEKFTLSIAVLAITTTVFLQVLSNLANDYGDSKKGTDNDNRVGPERAVQSGAISLREMKNGIITTTILSLLSGNEDTILKTLVSSKYTDGIGIIKVFLHSCWCHFSCYSLLHA